ncbi:MAG TPA: S8 family serine peptidase [Solirubrobacterales bacterium]|nr:S8 family serine peptidase [Solirubrobacterales bacterium]
MILGIGCSSRPARSASLAVLLAALVLTPATATARSGPSSDPELSPRLAELAQPEVRSLPPHEQARRLDVAAEGPGSLLRLNGRVVVDVRFPGGATAALDELRKAGGTIIASSRRYQTVTVAIAPGRLRKLADVRGVENVSEKRTPLQFANGPSAAAIGAECEGGSVVSEGVGQLNAATARSKYGVDGSGLTVGVLSDSYDRATEAADESGPVATHAADDVASGDLSGPANSCPGEKTAVDVIEDFPVGGLSDEGRGMLQIVHDIAPGASLAFATAFLSELSFAQNIERLAKPVSEDGAGAEVIVDDVVWFEEPFFQDGPIAVAVDKVAAAGAAYFSAAGNNNLFEGANEIASWEAPEFRDAGTCPVPLLPFIPAGTAHCMDFDPSPEFADTTFAITVSPGATLTLDLQWAEPWFGVETDLDAYLFDLGGNLLAAEENDNVGGSQRPVELPEWENTAASAKTVRLVINRCAGECNPDAGTGTPALKLALLQNGGGVTNTEYPSSSGGDVVGPTIFGHAAAEGAIAVAAVPYLSDNQVEKFSSRGPVTHRFEPVLDKEPADPLPTPETIAKPDLAATDCGATTFFSFLAGDGEWRFCGTSAAAPHAAAVAALQLEAEPAAGPEAIRNAQTATARPVGAFDPKAVGAGLLDADGAIAALLPPATIAIDEHPASRTADSTPTFGWESDPPGTEFNCSIDEVAPQPCTDPYTVPAPLPDGPHVFEVEGVDVAGAASFAFTVDTTAPAIAIGQQPAPISTTTKPTFGFTVGEPASVSCAIDAAVAQPCRSPHAPAQSLADGSHQFKLTATDQVGNTAVATVDFSVDTTPPTVVLMARPAERSTDRTPTFAFSASEPVSFTCGIDGTFSQACESPFVAPLQLADGSHAFEVLAVDAAGNSARAGAQFAIDTRPPQTAFRARPRALLRTRKGAVQVTLRLSADEPRPRFECMVDRGAWRPCGARLTRRYGPGRHVVRARARDELGNLDPSPAVARFRVERIGAPGVR